MERLTIGQMARLNHISEQTLRLYDKNGLLSPSEKGANGYRYYTVKQSARLDMIQYMKSLGMSLKDIKVQLDSKDLGVLKRILMEKSNRIDEQIRELQEQKRAIARTVESFDRYKSAPPNGAIVMEYIGTRYMYCIDSRINIYDHGLDVYEKILRDLKNSLIANHLPQIYFCNAGTVLRQQNVLQRRFMSTEVFVFVDPELVAPELITVIPAHVYLCIYCNHFDKEKEYATRLLDYAEKNGYTITGDYLCEAIADLPVLEDNERGMFLRLQVPISFR